MRLEEGKGEGREFIIHLEIRVKEGRREKILEKKKGTLLSGEGCKRA
jgi:hypothetical protein